MRANQVSGSVTIRNGGAVAGLVVEAWPLDPLDGPLASAIVAENGAFTLALGEHGAAEPRVCFRLFSGPDLLAALERELVPEGAVLLELPSAPKAAPPAGPVHVVRGRVQAEGGAPVVGARVRAFDKDLRAETLLGEATSDAGGRYEVRYPARAQGGRPGRHLVVRVFRGERAVAASPVRFDAPSATKIDVRLAAGVRAGLSTFAQLDAALASLLGDDAAALGPDELGYLGGRTGLAAPVIADYAAARRLASATGISAAAAFALVRQGLPRDATGLLTAARADHEAALVAAVADGSVPPELEAEAPAIGQRLAKLRATWPMRKPSGDEPTLGALLGAAGVSRGVQETFLRLVGAHSGPAAHLWRKVKNHPDGGAQAAHDLQFALQASALARGQVGLVHHLRDLRTRGAIASLRDLAGLEPAEWRARLEDLGVTAPLDAPSLDAYAGWISAHLEAGFPTAALVQRFARDPATEKRPAVKWLVTHPDFDLGHDVPRAHIEGNAAVVDDLERLQRLYRLSPRAAHVRALERAGFGSATAIATVGRDGFIAAIGGALGVETAERIFGLACRVALASFDLFVDRSPAFREPRIAAVPEPAPPVAIPGLDEIIAGRSRSESVLGPGAYLADLLGFLRDRRLPDGRTALDVLFTDRRADLGTLPLGGPAAQARVPRIELVLELLERAVAGDADRDHAAAAAAATLATATFPLALPFDRARAEARVYLDHVGVPRHEIMATFQRRDRSAPTDIDIAAEELGLLPVEVELVTAGFRACAPVRMATRSAVTLRGLPVIDGISVQAGDRVLVKHQPNPDDDGVYLAGSRAWTRAPDATASAGLIVEVDDGISRGSWVFGVAGSERGWARLRAPGETEAHERPPWEVWGFPDDGTITAATWPAPLADVDLLILRAGLSRAELDELLAVPWVNPPGDSRVVVEGAQVKNLTTAAARRILRFARLRRRIGWSAADLGRAVAILAPREITDRSLLALAELRRLAVETELSPNELLPLFGNLDEEAYRKLVGDEPEATEGGAAEAAEPRRISNHAHALAAALGVPAADLLLLVDNAAAHKLGLEAPVPDELSLANVSRILRRAILARAARLSMSDLLVVLALTGASPFDGDHIDETRRFLTSAGRVRAAKLSLAELDDVVRGGPTDATVGAALVDLRAAVAAAPADAADHVVVERLAAFLALSPEATRLLATEGVRTPRPALEVLRDNDPEALGVLLRLRRAALIVARLGLEPDVAFVVRFGGELDWIDFDGLPDGRSSAEDGAARFAAWQRLDEAVALRDALPPGTLFVLLETALDAPPESVETARAGFVTELAQTTGWPAVDVEALIAGLGLAFPRDFRDARAFARLRDCFALARRAGVPAPRLLAWRGTPFTLALARDAAATVRAHVDAETGRKLDAAARAARRDALVAYLLHARGASDAKLLSDRFLVDVHTEDAAVETRLEQAIASVRLFVQRCFLGLEPEVVFGPEDTRRWRWRADPKGWAAKRKILLYPADPGLGEPSAAVRAFAAELHPDRPEEALRGYLERVEDSARLEIAGLYLDERADVLHLVGRSAGSPRAHFYRARHGRAWGKWEPIGVEADGEAVLPVAWDGRIMVVWPVRDAGVLRLAWSERLRGGWTARRLGGDGVRVDADRPLRFVTSAGSDGQPVVTVLADATAEAPARSFGPIVGDAPPVPAPVLGAFRFGTRGPVVVDAAAVSVALPSPLRVPGQLRVARDDGSDLAILRRVPARHRLARPHQAGASSPLVFDDGERSYLVTLEGAAELPWSDPARWTPGLVDMAMRQPWPGGPATATVAGERLTPEPASGRFVFERLDPPLAGELMRRLAQGGPEAVFAATSSSAPAFEAVYDPWPGLAIDASPREDDDRELRIQVPLLAAERLVAEGRFADAQRWFHHVFDPADAERPGWKLLGTSDPTSIDDWLRAPLDPKQVARARAGAAQREVVRRYVTNLVAWGDQLVAQQAGEAAALLYRLAAKVLGPRPKPAAPAGGEAPTFDALAAGETNVLVALESFLPWEPGARPGQPGEDFEAVLTLGRALGRFAVPANEGLVDVWDRVAERLERVR